MRNNPKTICYKAKKTSNGLFLMKSIPGMASSYVQIHIFLNLLQVILHVLLRTEISNSNSTPIRS